MQLIVALFNRYEDAEKAIEHLTAGLFSMQAISVVLRQWPDLPAFADAGHRHYRDPGAILGGAPDDLNALLAGRRPVTLPHVGTVVVAGPLGRWLRRSRVALKTILLSVGLDEKQADAYQKGVRAGKIMLVLHHDSKTDDIVAALLDDLDFDIERIDRRKYVAVSHSSSSTRDRMQQ
ncbi:MAG: hypothetical protein M9918_25165 [Anaerolineae bacterium]|nr:hypothetical protein [Anaerolineae bacterium]MCO5191469.1 hypothetical protein [Anaerolineae bacterium]